MTKNKKLKIGIVCYPSVGGSGVVATSLGNELAKLGHQVHFISYEPPFKLDIKQKNIYFHKVELRGYSLFKYPDYTLPLAVKMVDVSHKYKLDIMHVHYAVPHATAALLAKEIAREEKLHFPNVVTTLHGTDITLLARDKTVMPVIKYSIESSCGVTAVSDSLRRDTVKVLKSNREIEVIHNFYDPKKVTKSASSVRKSLSVKESDFLAIHLSNLREVKRIPDLLRIISKVKSDPRIKLLILSGGDFSQYEPLVKKLGISGRIIVKSGISDIENYINAADAGIYTSEEESFGMGILETMSYGKPVLATKVGGVAEFMEHGKTGFLMPLGDIAEFAKNLKKLSLHPELTIKLGDQARAKVLAGFGSSQMVGKYLDYYRHIIKTCGI
jgi:N-acetyl-alpha-D-glucosaminyl L-malate synthase BshA